VVGPPDRSQLAGPCALFYAGDRDFDIRTVGRLVAEETRRPLPDITRQMRTTRGCIVKGMNASEAVALAERLEDELEAEILALSEADLVPLPDLMRMRKISIQPDGLRCDAYTWDQTEDMTIRWDAVFLISGGRLSLERVYEKEPAKQRRSRLLSGTGITPKVPELVTQRYFEFLFDIILADPWRRLRLDYNTAGYVFRVTDPEPDDKLAALRQSAEQLLRHARGIHMNRAVAFLAEGAPEEEWKAYTFFNKLDFDAYTHSLLQRVRYGYGA
jgi:hypothetical protein